MSTILEKTAIIKKFSHANGPSLTFQVKLPIRSRLVSLAEALLNLNILAILNVCTNNSLNNIINKNNYSH